MIHFCSIILFIIIGLVFVSRSEHLSPRCVYIYFHNLLFGRSFLLPSQL